MRRGAVADAEVVTLLLAAPLSVVGPPRRSSPGVVSSEPPPVPSRRLSPSRSQWFGKRDRGELVKGKLERNFRVDTADG